MIIKCMLDKKEYKNKPVGSEIAIITNRLEKSPVEIEIEELANSLMKGKTFKPSVLSGRKEVDFMETQLFALDFDENTTIEKELSRCVELNILPCFGYTSFSHTEEHHKFRLVFCANEVITDYETAKQLQLTLMNLFINCDEKCKNLSRLYFGGKELFYANYDNRIDYGTIINNYDTIENVKSIKANTKDNNVVGRIIPHDNKDITNTYTIMGDKTPTPNNTNYNLKALRNRDVEYLKEKIGNPRIVLENNQAFFDYIKGYDLGNLLEIKYSTSFRCIFHEDNSPSAGIFINEEGTYIYNCFSCGKSYNIINLIEMLGNYKSTSKAYKFMRDIFNLEIQENAWQKEQKEILQENRRRLRNGMLEEQCPTAYGNIKRNKEYLDQLLQIAEDNVYTKRLTDEEGNVIFFASTKYICKQMGLSENSAKEISKKNALFAYHDLLNKLSDGDIPEDMLKRSQAISVNSSNKNKKHVNYYSIPSYSTVLFKDIETQGQAWKNNNYSMTGCSREMFYRTEGQEIADKIYPQYSQVYDKEEKKIVDRTTKKISDLRTFKIVDYLFDIFTIRTYVLEKELIDELYSNGDLPTSKKEAQKQVKKSLNEILLSYDLKRIRCNKLIKEQYNVDAEGYPFIIVHNI